MVSQHIWRLEAKNCTGHWQIRWSGECVRTIMSLGPAWGPGRLQPQAWCPLVLPQNSRERDRSMAPSLAKQGLSSTKRDLDAWSHRGVIRSLWTLAEESWAVMDPHTVGPESGWRVGLCERPNACLEWQAWIGGIFLKEKEKSSTQQDVWGILHSSRPRLLHPYPHLAASSCPKHWGWRAPHPMPSSCLSMLTWCTPDHLAPWLPILPQQWGRVLRPGSPRTEHTWPCHPEAPPTWPLCLGPCKANWLSKRKMEMPLQRRAVGFRESTIPRKT